MTKEKIILGIDPGTRATGYALIKVVSQPQLLAFGVIEPKASLELMERCYAIYLELERICADFAITDCAVEDQFVLKTNPQSALKIGMAKASALFVATRRGVPIVQYAPRSIKLALTGQGNATKQTMQLMACRRFALKETPPEDACDAIGVAMCLAQKIGRPVYV